MSAPKGLDHPDMTPELAAELLPAGVRVPLPLLRRLGALLNPIQFAETPAGELIQLGRTLNGLLDAQLREAQERAV